MASATPNFQAAVKKAAVAVSEGEFEDVRDNVEIAARQASRQIERAANKVAGSAKKHPFIAAGAALGVGALLGALVYRVLSPKPTAGQVIWEALQSASASATKPIRARFHN